MRSARGSGIRGGKGFTLLEIVVAMAVLAVALSALLSTFNSTLYSVGRSANLTSAVTLAREEMELYRMETAGAPAPIAGRESGKEYSASDGEMRSRDEYPDLRFNRKMEPTAIPGAYELIVGVYQGDGDEPVQVYELRQYVVLNNRGGDGV